MASIGISVWLTHHVGYAINLTDSLPHKLYLVRLNKIPKKGDYVLFKALSSKQLPEGATLTKKIMGIKGDLITEKKGHFYINGYWVAKAKTHSLTGKPLSKGPTGILGEGQYYVGVEHQDSFDSRYQEIGWVSQNQCIGVAYPIW